MYSKNANPVPVTVTVCRCISHRRGYFVPPRHASPSNENGNSNEEIPLHSHKKKRDLSPVFRKIIKVLEERPDVLETDEYIAPEDQERGRSDVVVAAEVEATGGSNGRISNSTGDSSHVVSEEVSVSSSGSWFENLWNKKYENEVNRTTTEEEDGDDDDVEMVESCDNANESQPVTGKSETLFKRPANTQYDMLNRKREREYEGESEDEENLEDHTSAMSQKSQSSQSQAMELETSCDKKYYSAVYAKSSMRKHKRFENDGFIIISGESGITLKDISGKTIERSNNYKITTEMLEDGKVFKLGGKEVQILEKLTSMCMTSLSQPQPAVTVTNIKSEPLFKPPANTQYDMPNRKNERQREGEENLEAYSTAMSHSSQSQAMETSCDKKYYSALYGKSSTKKHKQFEDDGFIIISGGKVTLKDISGKTIERSNNYKITTEILEDGKTFKLGGKEVQIVDQLTSKDIPSFTLSQPVVTVSKSETLFKRPANNHYDMLSRNSEREGEDEDEENLEAHSSAMSQKSLSTQSQAMETSCDEKYFSAVYGKSSTRKHKRFENDGFIIISGEKVTLKNISGKTIESSNNFKITTEILEDGKVFQMGGKEVQIGEKLTSVRYE